MGLDQRASPPPSGRQAQGGGEGASVLLLAPSEAPPLSPQAGLGPPEEGFEPPTLGLGPSAHGEEGCRAEPL